jgi:alanine racemase
MVSDPADRAGAVLDIDLGAIAANWRLLAARVATAKCTAVVKANAYGLGIAPVAAALAAAGCRTFFVATLDEGIGLRAILGKNAEIAVFNGPLAGTEAEFAAHRLVPVLNDLGQVESWRRLAVKAPLPHRGRGRDLSPRDGRVRATAADPPSPASGLRPSAPSPALRERGKFPAMLHVDTGMARLGLSSRELATLVDDPDLHQGICWAGIMSHLACADTPDHPLNVAQLTRFSAARAHFPGLRASLAASSGIFLAGEFHHDLVRPGAALYGVNPRPGGPNPMRQVVTLKGKIVQVREIDSGESVGYGAAHVMSGPGRLATVAVGYADGWLRALSHRGCGRIAGRRVPLVGLVSMDLASFDVSAIDPASARPGDSIELLGADYGVDDAAADAGTIGYEILTALGARYHRRYRAAGSQ